MVFGKRMGQNPYCSIGKTRPDYTYMAITLDSETQFHQKLHFRKALIITFQMIYNLSGFAEVKISPLFLVMTLL